MSASFNMLGLIMLLTYLRMAMISSLKKKLMKVCVKISAYNFHLLWAEIHELSSVYFCFEITLIVMLKFQ